MLEETKGFWPNSMIRMDFLDEIADYVPDSCLTSARIVELGANHGGLTCRLAYLAKKNKLPNVIAVDIWDTDHRQAKLDNISDESYNIFVNNLKSNEVKEYVNIIRMPSSEYGEIFTDQVSFIIVDADHYYDGVVKDLIFWDKHIISGGVIYMDDFGPWGGTQGPEGAAFDTLLKKDEYKIIYRAHTFCLIGKK